MSDFVAMAILIGQIATVIAALAQIRTSNILMARIKVLEVQVFSMLTQERRAAP